MFIFEDSLLNKEAEEDFDKILNPIEGKVGPIVKMCITLEEIEEAERTNLVHHLISNKLLEAKEGLVALLGKQPDRFYASDWMMAPNCTVMFRKIYTRDV